MFFVCYKLSERNRDKTSYENSGYACFIHKHTKKSSYNICVRENKISGRACSCAFAPYKAVLCIKKYIELRFIPIHTIITELSQQFYLCIYRIEQSGEKGQKMLL